MTNATTVGHPDLKMVYPNAAEIDIGSTMHMAAVHPVACDMTVRAFGTFTQDIQALAAWFKTCGVTSVAMESTGVYWAPAFEILEALDLHVILVSARVSVNSYPSRNCSNNSTKASPCRTGDIAKKYQIDNNYNYS